MTDTVGISTTKFKVDQLNPLGRGIYQVFRRLRLVSVVESEEEFVEMNNLTIINLVLRFHGPMHERRLTCVLLGFQVVCSSVAFFIRYQGAKVFYDV